MLVSGTALLAGVGSGTLAAGLLDTTDPVTAVADRVIERAPRGVKDVAIALFGTADKLALGVGIVIILLAAGTATARIGVRRRTVLPTGVLLFAVVGQLALGSPGLATVAIAVTAAVTWAALALLVPPAPAETAAPDAEESSVFSVQPMPMPRWEGRPGRRELLVRAGWLGAGGLGALAVNSAVGRRRDTEIRSAAPTLDFPTPGSPAAAPDIPRGASVGEGVAPFITPTADFYRIDTAFVIPRVRLDDWALKIHGAVRTPLTITYDELVGRPMIERAVTLACVSNEVGGNLVGTATWLGVPLSDLLEEAGVKAGGEQVYSRSVDGWTCGFPTEIALDGRDALVAVAMNGETLSFKHGFPARLVVPGLYGYVSATKWLNEIELTGWDDEDGFWIPRGWSKEAPVKTQSRIDVPRRGNAIGPGATTIAGVAWAQHRGISRVEVRVDDGEWVDAELGDDVSDDTWRQWFTPWDATSGQHQISVRATDGDGVTQIERPSRPDPDGATGWHTVTVGVD